MSVAAPPPGQVRFNGVLLPRSLWPPGRASREERFNPRKAGNARDHPGRPIGALAAPPMR
jgi:hypothetical protein